jgi:hypothetical protein
MELHILRFASPTGITIYNATEVSLQQNSCFNEQSIFLNMGKRLKQYKYP